MSTTSHRLSKIISEVAHTDVTNFERQMGASNTTLRKPIDNNKEIGTKWLIEVCKKYPQVNPEWLLTGKGEMLRKESNQLQEPAPEYGEFKEKYENLLKLYEKTESENESLKDHIQTLKTALKSHEKTIADKEEKIAELSGKVKAQKTG